MSDISAIADWLRQRPGETDIAWIERLQATLDPTYPYQALDASAAAKADRVGGRLWKHFMAQRARNDENG